MNRNSFSFSLLVTGLVLIVSCPSCADGKHGDFKEDQSSKLIQEATQELRTGDLILRTGNDFSSEQVRDLSKKEKMYSHGGIVCQDSGRWFVYHVEPDYYYINDKVRKEPIDSFLTPRHNLGFAIGRYDIDSNETAMLVSYLDRQYRNKVPFDMDFELGTDDKLYCSEMIRKGLAAATKERILIVADKLDDHSKFKLIKQYFKLPEKSFANREIVAIDQLYLNPYCRIFKRVKFAP